MLGESFESFKLTEAWEWAKRKGNSKAVISMLQPFKLKCAEILVDFGFEKEAKKYIDNIRKCNGLKGKYNMYKSKILGSNIELECEVVGCVVAVDLKLTT
jgi:hypothetical protein